MLAVEQPDPAAPDRARGALGADLLDDRSRGEDSPGPGFERCTAAERAADVHLSGTDLDWLIIRPGTLTDDPGTGRAAAGAAITYGDIPRADVAAVIAHAVFAPSLNRLAIEITNGAQTIEAALSRLAAGPWQPGLS